MQGTRLITPQDKSIQEPHSEIGWGLGAETLGPLGPTTLVLHGEGCGQGFLQPDQGG